MLARNGLRFGIAFVLLGAAALASALWLYWETPVGSVCGDGWLSESTGAGRCSSHDGVGSDIAENTFAGVAPDRAINVSRSALMLFGLADLAIGAVLIRRATRMRRQPQSSAETSSASSAASDHGVVELTAKVRRGHGGRTVEVHVDGGPTTRMPFFFRNDQGRAARHLSELMLTAKKRRFGRRGRGTVEAYGTELFEALFPGPARRCYSEALAVALRANTRLRVSLDLDERTGDLPWEYLYDSERGSFLAMSQDTTVIRTLSYGRSTRASEPVNTIRLLVMAVSPRGLEPLNVVDEQEQIRRLVSSHGGRVGVRRVNGDTLDDLRVALREYEPQIFYFVGHGQWDDEQHDGAVAFADDQGRHHAVTGRDLGVVLNRPNLRLVLFNSCHGARTSRQDRFAGVAGSLVAQGVPAAIGMQYRIEDRTATSFGTEFLASLIGSRSIDHALTEARMAVYTSHNGMEWATPVMTTRVPVDDIIAWT